MIGDLITRVLVMFLGYAYPAFECFKTVEKNRIEIEELRFWCQYWIIVALMTVFERFLDVFISWVPMYGEMKLAFIIYLWYPKTKGTSFVYNTFLQPYIAKHETHIDRKMLEVRARAWDLAILHWQNCANYGQTTFYQIIQYLASQSRDRNTNTQKVDTKYANEPPAAASSTANISFPGQFHKQTQQAKKKWPPTPAPPPPPTRRSTINRLVSQPPESDLIEYPLPSESQSEATLGVSHSDYMPNSTDTQDIDMNETLLEAKTRLRRSRSRPKQ